MAHIQIHWFIGSLCASIDAKANPERDTSALISNSIETMWKMCFVIHLFITLSCATCLILDA